MITNLLVMQQASIDAKYIAIVVLEEYFGVTTGNDLQLPLLRHFLTFGVRNVRFNRLPASFRCLFRFIDSRRTALTCLLVLGLFIWCGPSLRSTSIVLVFRLCLTTRQTRHVAYKICTCRTALSDRHVLHLRLYLHRPSY